MRLLSGSLAAKPFCGRGFLLPASFSRLPFLELALPLPPLWASAQRVLEMGQAAARPFSLTSFSFTVAGMCPERLAGASLREGAGRCIHCLFGRLDSSCLPMLAVPVCSEQRDEERGGRKDRTKVGHVSFHFQLGGQTRHAFCWRRLGFAEQLSLHWGFCQLYRTGWLLESPRGLARASLYSQALLLFGNVS